jgi:hypothetical protein
LLNQTRNYWWTFMLSQMIMMFTRQRSDQKLSLSIYSLDSHLLWTLLLYMVEFLIHLLLFHQLVHLPFLWYQVRLLVLFNLILPIQFQAISSDPQAHLLLMMTEACSKLTIMKQPKMLFITTANTRDLGIKFTSDKKSLLESFLHFPVPKENFIYVRCQLESSGCLCFF